MENREVRLIDARKISNDIGLYLAENAYLNDTALDALKMAARWVNDAPTIGLGDLWPHAKWTKDHTCTNCGEYALEAPENHCYYHTIYCPHCGAFMDKED